MKIKSICLLSAALVLTACSDPSDSSGGPGPGPGVKPESGTASLWLENLDGDKVAISYERGEGDGPRIMELWLKVDNFSTVREWSAGSALEAAHKTLVVQDKGNGLIRVVALASDNTTLIGSGSIAELEFERRGTEVMHAEILTDRPMFAPQEAQMGLIVGDSIEL